MTLHCPAKVENVSRSEESVSLVLDNGETLSGKLLVAADGSRSTLGARCGISWQQEPYEQLAIIANVSTAQPHSGRAFERFTPHGPLAMLPMSQGRCSLVWCHPQSRREEVLSWSDERFRHELQQAFGWRLGTGSSMPESAACIRSRLPEPAARLRIGWRWSATRRKRCILLPGRDLTSVCATS